MPSGRKVKLLFFLSIAVCLMLFVQQDQSNRNGPTKFIDAQRINRRTLSKDRIKSYRANNTGMNQANSDVVESEDAANYLAKLRTTTDYYSAIKEPKINSSKDIDCSKLMEGDMKERVRVTEFLDTDAGQYKVISPRDYIAMTADCDHFIKTRRYIMDPTEEELAFPLAFSIRMHFSVEQAERLLRAIYRPHNRYCIHVDQKSPELVHAAMSAIASCLPNVKLATRMVYYDYATYSPVEVDLICMRDLIKSPVKWKYLLTMAGTEFPLQTNQEMVQVLRFLNGTNDIEQYEFFEHYHDRFKYVWKQRGNYIQKTSTVKQPFPGVELRKGCSYNSYSRAFVQWVLTDKLARAFIDWSNDTASPDETVWATLNNLEEAPGGYHVWVSQNAKTFLSREVIWHHSPAYCHGTYVHEICMLSFRELPWLNGRWEFFANKFDLERDYVGYACLEEKLRDKVKRGKTEVAWYRIKEMPHVQYAMQRNNQIGG